MSDDDEVDDDLIHAINIHDFFIDDEDEAQVIHEVQHDVVEKQILEVEVEDDITIIRDEYDEVD